MDGIGDTIRVSLSSDPVDEIKAGYEILKSLGIRSRGVNIISCPSCARQAFPVIETVKELEKKLAHIKKPISLSIIGCVVNGPGEAAQTEIGLTGGGQDNNLLYLSGIPHTKIPSSKIYAPENCSYFNQQQDSPTFLGQKSMDTFQTKYLSKIV